MPPAFPALAGGFFTTEPPGKPCSVHTTYHISIIYSLGCSSLLSLWLISLFHLLLMNCLGEVASEKLETGFYLFKIYHFIILIFVQEHSAIVI